jgi:hypothetical protein
VTMMDWHLTQFYPAYRMLERRPTPVATLRHARMIGLDVGLRYTYEGNVPGEEGEDTHCHACKPLLIRRYGVFLLSNRIRQGTCHTCGVTFDGLEMDGSSQARHERFVAGGRNLPGPQSSALFGGLDLEVRNLLHDVRAPTPRALKAFFPLALGLGDGKGQGEILTALLTQKLIEWHGRFSSAASDNVSSIGTT